MLFNSLQFVIFFVIVTVLYYNLSQKYRWLLLLLSSCYFYMAFVPVYILILGFTIVVDYYAGLFIEKSTGRKRKWLLICSLIANIGVLFVFKYYNFINFNISEFTNSIGYTNPFPYLNILLPIGLSFHTFQAMSYTIEVYRGNQPAEHHFGIYALYVMFFPQLVAGPIERPQNILHQFRKKIKYNRERVLEGLQIMMWGFFKKVVVADRLAVLVDTAYQNPEQYSGLSNLVATLFFSIEIYCDFSGYSDIAIGSAKVLGIDLMKNFNRPYLSKSVTEFWQRWHISLSTWFRDYLYIPLGGSRVSKLKIYRNIFIVFIISGIWHGANWTFLFWGLLHGTFIVIERLTKKVKFLPQNFFGNWIRIASTFTVVTLAWVFFRATSLHDALIVLKSIFTDFHVNKATISECLFLIAADNTSVASFIVCVCAMLFMFFVEFKTAITNHPLFMAQPKKQFVFYSLLLFSVLFLGYFRSNAFIYFQF